MHFAFELLPQVTLCIKVEYILSVGIYTQKDLPSNLAIDSLIDYSIF